MLCFGLLISDYNISNRYAISKKVLKQSEIM